MSAPPKPMTRIDAERKAKIGNPKYYNIDKKTWVATGERAIATAQKKDPSIIYDLVYGLVSNDQEYLDRFIEFNELQPLGAVSGGADDGEEKQDGPGPSSAVAASSVASSSTRSETGSRGSMTDGNGLVGNRSSKTAMDQLRKITEKLKTLTPGKYINVSTIREVLPNAKKGLIFNHGKKLAARDTDQELLDEIVVALGGSPSGPASSMGDEDTEPIEPPKPISKYVSRRVQLTGGRTVFGRPEDLEEERKQDDLGESMESLSLAPTEDQPAELQTKIRATLNRRGVGLPFANKKPLTTVFTIAKP